MDGRPASRITSSIVEANDKAAFVDKLTDKLIQLEHQKSDIQKIDGPHYSVVATHYPNGEIKDKLYSALITVYYK